MLDLNAYVYAEKPQKDIHSFIGTFNIPTPEGSIAKDTLSIENTIWANTVVASGEL